MKKYFNLLFASVAFTSMLMGQNQVGINTPVIDPSAVFEITSTERGVLFPRMTSGQRRSIASPATGLLVYETNTRSFWYYVGAEWVEIISNNQIQDGIGDLDADTRIFSELTGDNDQLRFYQEGTEYFRLRGRARFEAVNTGNSVFVGDSAGRSDDLSNNQNVYFGSSSAINSTTGARNVIVGYEAFKQNVDQMDNVVFGSRALFNSTGARRNVCIGTNSFMSANNPDNVVSIGNNVLSSQTSGGNTTVIGVSALSLSVSAASTVAMGNGAMRNINDGDFNVVLGHEAGLNALGDRYIAIGHRAAAQNISSNFLFVDNNETSTPLIEGDFADDVLTVNGDLSVREDISHVGTITDVSDRRLKKNISKENNTLEKIKKLQGYRYYLISGNHDRKEFGLIAQEVEQVFPLAVVKIDSEGHKGLSYIQLIPLIMEAEKEQYHQLFTLRKQLDAQGREVALMKDEVQKMKDYLNVKASNK